MIIFEIITLLQNQVYIYRFDFVMISKMIYIKNLKNGIWEQGIIFQHVSTIMKTRLFKYIENFT